MGTFKACQEATKFIDEESGRILETIAVEGPRWVPYKRLEEVYYGVKLPKQVAAEIEGGE